MKSDIQIAQEATMQPIKEVAASIGIAEDDIELYGKYKAKISDELIERSKNNPDGKLILVTAINPTPAGEGKTTITVGLGQAFGKLGKKAIIALREPSLGPCFGLFLFNLGINGNTGNFMVHTPVLAFLSFIFTIFLIPFIVFLCGLIYFLSAFLHAF